MKFVGSSNPKSNAISLTFSEVCASSRLAANNILLSIISLGV
jgi:hypothetical protein